MLFTYVYVPSRENETHFLLTRTGIVLLVYVLVDVLRLLVSYKIIIKNWVREDGLVFSFATMKISTRSYL